MRVWAIALDVLREASSRRWLLALGVAVTAALLVIALSLKLEVVDGALAASHLFGASLGTDVRAAEVAMHAVFGAAAMVIYYAGLPFGVLLCADFAPRLLAPGRVEQLLSLPLRRGELLLGTWLGVLVLATGASLYAAGGLAFVLGVKTGVWAPGPFIAAALAGVTFAALYAAMLAAAVFVRSAALSGFVGLALYTFGIAGSYRLQAKTYLAPGAGREILLALTAALPRVAALGDAAGRLAADAPVEWPRLAALVGGALAFALGALAVAELRFEWKDY
ncbi:MAG TPA: hypothetical protein VMB50_13975 [Myxococcales bacterium]|nr:hypothetical protein [Myxococcales bacterium]